MSSDVVLPTILSVISENIFVNVKIVLSTLFTDNKLLPGSGYESVLKQVSVPVVSNKKCNLPGWRNCVVKACMLCAGDINIDPCGGDSGS